MVEVDPDDPAFADPTKFIGPVYERAEAERLAAEKGWAIKQDGDKWRRVVASPLPKRIFEIRPINWLLEQGAVVICTGGGGIPTMYETGHAALVGAEVVIDKDRASARCSPRELEADLFVMATDVDARLPRLRHAAADADRAGHDDRAAPDMNLPAGSMGPKVEAAVDFAERTGKRAAIGTLAEIGGVVAGTHGHADRGRWLTVADPPTQARGDARRNGVRRPSLASRSLAIGILIVADLDDRRCCSARTRRAARCRSRCSPARCSPGFWRCGWAIDGAQISDAAVGGVSSAMGADLHPARGRRADRHLEHGRHDPDGRLLRHRRCSSRAFFYLSRARHLRRSSAWSIGSSWTTAATLGVGARRAGAAARRFDP